MSTAVCDSPKKIICLTEESVETLALLGELRRVVGVSIFVRRPVEATRLPKVSAFTDSKVDTIVELAPDLVLGFSDIQKDIARELIGLGLNVWIANHRTVPEIFAYVLQLARLVDRAPVALELIADWQSKIEELRSRPRKFRPRVYFEEWDAPMISAIAWVSELIEICGGENIFAERAKSSLAQGRFCQDDEVIERDPDLIIACWCGKRARLDSIRARPGWQEVRAVQTGMVVELPAEIFLQPGPALFVDGLRILSDLLERVPPRP